jgi:hypothetical protein
VVWNTTQQHTVSATGSQSHMPLSAMLGKAGTSCRPWMWIWGPNAALWPKLWAGQYIHSESAGHRVGFCGPGSTPSSPCVPSNFPVRLCPAKARVTS